MTPMLRHCMDCDKPAQVILDDVFYCASCAMKNTEAEPTTADKFNKELEKARNSGK
tara:strand:- start:954 stop:1121 length:168 start_codon:yes stop_codon:yes gene_type:complete